MLLRVARGAAVLAIAEYVSLIISTIISLLIIATLTPAPYGAYRTVLEFYSLVIVPLRVFAASPLTVLASYYVTKNKFLAKRTLMLYTLILVSTGLATLLVGGFGLFILSLQRSDLWAYLLLLLPCAFFEVATATVRGLLVGLMAYEFYSTSRISETLLLASGYASLICLNYVTITNLLIVRIVAWCGVTALTLFFLHVHVSHHYADVAVEHTSVKSVLSFAKFFGVHAILESIVWRLDAVVLPHFVSDYVLGLYFFAKRIYLIFLITFASFERAYIPALSRVYKSDKAKLVLALSLAFKLELLLGMVSSVLLYSSAGYIMLFMSLLIPKLGAYIPATPLLRLFFALALPRGIIGVFRTLFDSMAKFEWNVICDVAQLTSLLVAMLPLVNMYREIGMVAAYIVAHVIGAAVYVLLGRRHSFKVQLSVCKIVASAVLAFVVSALLCIGALNLLLALALLVLSGSGSFLLALKLGLFTKEEVRILSRVVRESGMLSRLVRLLRKFVGESLEASQ